MFSQFSFQLVLLTHVSNLLPVNATFTEPKFDAIDMAFKFGCQLVLLSIVQNFATLCRQC